MTQPFNPHLLWHLQIMNDQRDLAESDQARLTRELARVKAWGDQIAELVSALEDLSEYFEKYAASRPPGLGVSLPEQSLRELSNHFHDVRPDMSWKRWVCLAVLCLPRPAFVSSRASFLSCSQSQRQCNIFAFLFPASC